MVTAAGGESPLASALTQAQQRLTEAREARTRFEEAHKVGPTDPGLHSFNKHLTERQVNKGVTQYVNKMRRQSQAWDKLQAEVTRLAWDVKQIEQQIRNAGTAHTLTDLPNARAVRDKEGWHPVIRVNKTTVTVPRGYGLDDKRIPHALILEVKAN